MCIDVLITISSAALELMGGSTTIFENILPNLKLQHVRDSEYVMFPSRAFPCLFLDSSMFDAVLQWLDNPSLQYPGRYLAGDLRSHQALHRGMPVLHGLCAQLKLVCCRISLEDFCSIYI